VKITRALICIAILCTALFASALYAAGGGDPATSEADDAFFSASSKSDKAGLGELLDADFLWIDMTGKVLNRREVLEAMPMPNIPPLAGLGPMRRRFDYDQVATFQDDYPTGINKGMLHLLRIWVKRPAGWRVLVYQEVKSLDAPPTITPGAGKVCINPCKSVGYTPKDDTEKAVIRAYEALESSAVAKDADAWDANTAAEFVAVSSNSDKLLDKATRLAEMRRANMAGLSPTPLVSARLSTFGDVVVMISRHVPDQGKPLQITRLWVLRNGNWVAALSYQTTIEKDSLRNLQR